MIPGTHNKDDCRKGLHIWEVLNETKQGTLEQCSTCGKRKGFDKNKGKEYDRHIYSKEHKTDFLQPFTDGNFERIYGNVNKK